MKQARVSLLNGISGVWKPETGAGLTVISASGNDIQIAQGDTLLPAALGDVDVDNNTVNVKLFWKSGKQEVRTINLVSCEECQGPSTITITAADGSQRNYSFVRKVTQDDLNRIGALSGQATAPAPVAVQPQPSAATNRGVVDMYLGGIDMNMRSCPGSTCAAVIIVPKDSKVSVDTATMRDVTESSGNNTPWVRVTYEGAYCTSAEQDSQTGCMPTHGTDAPVTGWMNYTRLLSAPRPQQ
ncbi:hypothetical protein P9239_04845 [Caballeronia sp. LZ062]|uniref:hypothetical protein n=1 Tax=unclassified Caballeronia TaxID=2646786 RepID=UPI00285A330A|nr:MULTISPECIES: hypothetical protein [unclassified Caballeronia]MDR5856918.1 hypothetical protein [Caballeronia sp. LZ050]MDR5869685.1 hypothetical protein [Caballeronia sp. LZ062]